MSFTRTPPASPAERSMPAPRRVPLLQFWITVNGPDGIPHLEARWQADPDPC